MITVVDINGNPLRGDSNVLESVPIEGVTSDRLKPRQVMTGLTRGRQRIQGTYEVTDNADTRVLIGQLPDQTYGMKVSKPGFDVLTASDADLIFNTSNNVFKIVQSGLVTVGYVANSGFATTSVPHSLGYIPAVIAYYTDPSTSAYSPIPQIALEVSGVNSGKVAGYFSVASSQTAIECDVYAPNYVGNSLYTTSVNYTFKYYLLQETAN